jgi:hypothetical protein
MVLRVLLNEYHCGLRSDSQLTNEILWIVDEFSHPFNSHLHLVWPLVLILLSRIMYFNLFCSRINCEILNLIEILYGLFLWTFVHCLKYIWYIWRFGRCVYSRLQVSGCLYNDRFFLLFSYFKISGHGWDFLKYLLNTSSHPMISWLAYWHCIQEVPGLDPNHLQ